MGFSDEINQAIKDAMRAKDKVRLSTLRDIKSKIMVEATSGSGNNVGDDVYFFASGSIASAGTSVRGTAVFGGDVVVSGSLNVAGQGDQSESLKVVILSGSTSATSGKSSDESSAADVSFYVSVIASGIF